MPVRNGLYNVVVAWDMKQGDEGNEKMRNFFVKALTLKKENGFMTDEDHLYFLSTKEEVDAYISDGKCDALIIAESLNGEPIGTGAIKAWKKVDRDIKVILVMNNKKKGSGKAQGLYKMSYYRGLFMEDFSASTVFSLLCKNREPMEAFEYYGVGYYREKDDYAAKKKEAEDREKAVLKSSAVKDEVNKEPAEESATEEPSKEEKKSSKKDKSKAKDSSKKAKKKDKPKKAAIEENIPTEDEGAVSTAEQVMERAVNEKALHEASFDELLDESESFGGDSSFLGSEEDDEILSDYANIEETDDENDNTDDTLALDLLIPADLFEEEMDINKALEGSDDDALAYIRAREKEAFAPSDIYYEPNLVDDLCERVLTYYTLENPTNMSNLEQGIMSREEFDYELNRFLEKLEVEQEILEQVKANFYEFMWGYDIITPFINDPTISDIKLEAPNRIRIKRHGKRYFSKIVFRSDNHYKSFISHIARKNFVNLKDGKPDKTFMDTTTSDVCRLRFVLSTEYINSNNFPTLVIRKVPNQKYTVEQLVNAGMMSAKTAAFLIDEVRAGKSFLVTGCMASGKTTWMNTMLDFISHGKSILAIQENEELFSNVHPDAMFQRIQTSDDGELTYDLRYLSTYGLLMDVNYFMVGELKGAESKQFVDAVYTNTICWASLHCPSSKDALPRVADMAKFDSDYTEEALLDRLASGIDYVIFLEEFKVKEISRVKGFNRKIKEVEYEEIPLL